MRGQEKVRSFKLSKQGFSFASAHLTDLLATFESEQLARLTPFNPESVDELISGLAQVHVGFGLRHTFREGNGRIARLVCDVMARQAGIGPLDNSAWDQQRDFCFAAIRGGLC